MLQLWEDVWKALLRVQPAFQGTIGGPKAPWRIHPKNFKDPGECEPLPGNINLSPAWFQQAHDVSNPITGAIAIVSQQVVSKSSLGNIGPSEAS